MFILRFGISKAIFLVGKRWSDHAPSKLTTKLVAQNTNQMLILHSKTNWNWFLCKSYACSEYGRATYWRLSCVISRTSSQTDKLTTTSPVKHTQNISHSLWDLIIQRSDATYISDFCWQTILYFLAHLRISHIKYSETHGQRFFLFIQGVSKKKVLSWFFVLFQF